MSGETEELQAPKVKPRRRWPWLLLLPPLLLLLGLNWLLRTDSGLEVVRGIAVNAANDTLLGTLSIDALRGDILDELIVEGIEVHDPEGQPAVQLAKLRIRWQPQALADGVIKVDVIELVQPHINALTNAAGQLNLARLVAPSPPDPTPQSDPFPLDLPHIELARLEIQEGLFVLTSSAAKATRIDDLSFTVSAQTRRDTLDFQLLDFRARALEKHAIQAALQAEVRGRQVRLRALKVEIDGASVQVPEMVATMPSGELEGQAQVHLPAGLAAKFGGPPQIQAPLDLHIDFRRSEQPVWAIEARGELAGAQLSLSSTATEALDDLRIRLDISKLAPKGLHTSAPDAQLTLHLLAQGNLANPSQPVATATLSIDGWLTPPGQATLQISGLGLRTQLDGESVELQVSGAVSKTLIKADIEASHLMSGPVLDRARAELTIPSLAAILGAQAEGSFTLVANARGPLTDLSADGQMLCEGLRWGQAISVDEVRADWALSGLPETPHGSAQVHVVNVVADQRPIQSVNIEVSATQKQDAIFIDIQALDLTMGGLVWKAKGASVTRDGAGKIELHDFSLLSLAGSLGLEAEVADPGRIRAQILLEDLNLSALPRSVLPELADLAGYVNLSADVQKSGAKISAQVKGSLSALQLAPGRPDVDSKFLLQLDPRQWTVTASIGTDAMGTINVVALGTPPGRMDSGPAWARSVKVRPLDRARIELRNLKLTELQALVGQGWVSAGEVAGSVSIDGGRQAVDLQIELRGLTEERLQAATHAQVLGGYTPGQAWARAQVGVDNFANATVTASIAAPGRLFDTVGWTRLDRSAVKEVEVQVHQLSLNLLQRLGLVPGLQGQLTARVHATANAESITAAVQVEAVQVPQLPGTWSAESNMKVDGTELQHTLEAHLDGASVLRTRLSVPRSLAQLIRLDAASMNKVPLALKASIDALPLKPFAEFAKLPKGQVQGTLTAAIDAEGTVETPQATVSVGIAGLRLAKTRFSALTASVALDRSQLLANMHIQDTAGGRLGLKALVYHRRKQIEAELSAKRLDLSFISKLGVLPIGLQAALSAELALTGDMERPTPRGWLALDDLRIAFAQAALQPLHDGKARIDIEPESAKLTMDAESGGGSLGIQASAQFPRSGAPKFDATTTLKAFPVAAGSLVRIDMVARAQGQIEPTGTKVQVTLSDGLVNVPKEDAEALHPIEELDDVVFVDQLVGGTDGEPAKTSTVTSGPPTLVSIRTIDPIDVRGGPVDAAFVAELNADGGRGTVRGRVNSSEGAITLFRRRYVIEKAQLTFEGRSPPNPRVNVRLRHEFDDLSFSVLVQGDADAPDLEFSASPARFSQSELLTIFLGTDPADLGKQDDRSVEQQAVGAVAGFLVGQLQDKLGRALPIDTLDVELGDVAAGGAGTRVTLGKWITRKLFLAYRYKFEADTQQENDNESVVQYRFLPGWMIEVVLGLTRQDADLLWTKRF